MVTLGSSATSSAYWLFTLRLRSREDEDNPGHCLDFATPLQHIKETDNILKYIATLTVFHNYPLNSGEELRSICPGNPQSNLLFTASSRLDQMLAGARLSKPINHQEWHLN